MNELQMKIYELFQEKLPDVVFKVSGPSDELSYFTYIGEYKFYIHDLSVEISFVGFDRDQIRSEIRWEIYDFDSIDEMVDRYFQEVEKRV